jgi:hypothetical protein
MATTRESELAGWGYGSQGACYDPVTCVHFPWHDPYNGSDHQKRDVCTRCGERDPRSLATPREPKPHRPTRTPEEMGLA